jgi:uncharacterized membrane protein
MQNSMMQPKTQLISRWHAKSFFGLAAFTLFSWVCYVLFVQNPENLQAISFFPLIFSRAFSLFAQVHVLLCFWVVSLLISNLGQRNWPTMFAAVFLVSLTAEMGGTTIGFPFGHYEYSSLLGFKLFNHVPILIPMSWFAVSSCGYAISSHFFPGRRIMRVVFTSLSLVLWDLSLDPAMSFRFSYWVWDTTHPVYYGMPAWNLVGWFATGLCIGGVFEIFNFKDRSSSASVTEWLKHYFLFVSLGLGFTVLAGLWISVLFSVVGYALVGLAIWFTRDNSLRRVDSSLPSSLQPFVNGEVCEY